MNNIVILSKAEFRKFWSLPKIIFFASVFILIFSVFMLPFLIEGKPEPNPANTTTFSFVLSEAMAFMMPILALILTTGAIAYDRNSFWLRSLLARPITRQDYLTAKLLSLIFSLFILILFFALIPSLFVPVFYGLGSGINFFDAIIIFVNHFLQGILYIVISLNFSFILPNFLNSFAVAIWLIIDLISNFLVTKLFWHKQWAVVVQDFLFPGGFGESAKVYVQTLSFPYTQFLWGLSALFAFLALSYWFISYISPDKSSE